MPQKKKKRKLRKSAVLLIGLGGLVLIGALGWGLASAASAAHSNRTEPVTADGTEIDRVDLASLKGRISDVLKKKALGSLRENIQTYIFNNELSDLKSQINEYLASTGADLSKISWAVQDLTTEAYVESDNAAQDFTAASTYKLPLTMLYYEMIANGAIKPTDTIEFTEQMREEEDKENPDQPIARKYKVGDKIQIDELLEAALVYSDNVAGHMLYENLGGYSNFKQAALRYTDTPQSKEFTSYQNVFNSHYMMNLLKYLYETPGTFNDLKYWLKVATYDMFLNQSVPWTYIQKIGNIDATRNAVGYFSGPYPYSISVYSSISKEQGEQILADLGALVFNYFNQKYHSGFYDGYDTNRTAELSSQIGSPEDVIVNRPGLNGQVLPPVTDQELANAANRD